MLSPAPKEDKATVDMSMFAYCAAACKCHSVSGRDNCSFQPTLASEVSTN